MDHYRAEKIGRSSLQAQIDMVARDERPSFEAKMPRLVPSYVYDKIFHHHYSPIYICNETDWRSGNKTMTCVEFDPLSQEDYEKFSKDPGDLREPNVLPETQVEVGLIGDALLLS